MKLRENRFLALIQVKFKGDCLAWKILGDVKYTIEPVVKTLQFAFVGFNPSQHRIILPGGVFGRCQAWYVLPSRFQIYWKDQGIGVDAEQNHGNIHTFKWIAVG
jgi:hypothetical protein